MWILVSLCVAGILIVFCLVILPQMGLQDESNRGVGFYVAWTVVGIVILFTLMVLIRYTPLFTPESWHEISWEGLREVISH